jgi:hypothetical protein
MAIDLEAIRSKLNQLSGGGSRRNMMWRPQEGEEHTVRLMSFPDNDGQPFKERWFYYNIGNNPGLLSPHQFGKPDPVQNLINELRNDSSKESYELAKKLYPKMRVYAPVIVRGEEDKGVRLWAFGKTVYQSLLNIMLDEDYGDITDPTDGRDVKVICTKAPGRQWATTEVRPRGKPSKLTTNGKQAKEWSTSMPELDDLYTVKEFDELEQIVNQWLNGDEGDKGDNSTGTFRGSDSSSFEDTASDTTKSDDPGKTYNKLEEAFADLENEFA